MRLTHLPPAGSPPPRAAAPRQVRLWVRGDPRPRLPAGERVHLTAEGPWWGLSWAGASRRLVAHSPTHEEAAGAHSRRSVRPAADDGDGDADGDGEAAPVAGEDNADGYGVPRAPSRSSR
eukprot:scaffold2033_cov367-Prasinococcus_capsulatus_cf.AAC.6